MNVKYKDFPEFDKLPDKITASPDFLDRLYEKSKREKRVQWLERKNGKTAAGNPISKAQTKRGWFPPEKRVEVVTAYCAGMTNASDLEELTKVPAGTIRVWKTREWWHDLVERIHVEKDAELDAKFTKIIDKTLNRIVTAIDEGDTHLTKTGQLVKVPVKARDAAMISAMMVDKRNLLRGKPTSRTEKISDSDRLTKLAADFRKFAGAKTIQGEVLSAETEETKDQTEAEEADVLDV